MRGSRRGSVAARGRCSGVEPCEVFALSHYRVTSCSMTIFIHALRKLSAKMRKRYVTSYPHSSTPSYRHTSKQSIVQHPSCVCRCSTNLNVNSAYIWTSVSLHCIHIIFSKSWLSTCCLYSWNVNSLHQNSFNMKFYDPNIVAGIPLQ
jgi:hypothetical protein